MNKTILCPNIAPYKVHNFDKSVLFIVQLKQD